MSEETNNELFKTFNQYNIRNLYTWQPLFKLLDENKIAYPESKIKAINKRLNHNLFEIKDCNDKVSDMFIKYTGLLDYTKYLTGKYLFDEDLFNLPTNDSIPKKSVDKLYNPYNSAYIDGYFSYLSSKLLHDNNFFNGINYFASFIANQKNYQVNIIDDLDYLANSRVFIKNIDKKFKVDPKLQALLSNNKPRLTILDDNIKLSDIIDIKNLEEPLLSNKEDLVENTIEINLSDSDNETENESDNDDLESVTSDESSEEPIYAYITDYPINMICLEKLDDTLDNYMSNNEIDDKEWTAILMQVIIILLVYQRAYQFTHNDLHTNNIMFIKTDKQYLHYKINNKYYKIPTYGKIWKIIDFGRAIYTYKNVRFASDSFFENEDAYSQYNCEPFFNQNKNRIEPNYSFDLCRLACSLYDYFIDDDSEKETFNDIQLLIYSWCLDDKEKNILYKKTGEERYPDFKLYKMIARLVHKHTPEAQLENSLFKQFLVNKKKISKKASVFDCDNLCT